MSGSMGQDRSKATLPRVNFDDFVVTDLVDETLVYDLRNHRAHCLNRVAATIWRHCDGRTTVGQVARRIGAQAGVPADAALVLHGLQGLQKSGLVEAPETPKAFGARVSRRDVIKRIGIGSALALPLVTSIVAPTAVSAQTGCGAEGIPCTNQGGEQGLCCDTLRCISGACAPCVPNGTVPPAPYNSLCFGGGGQTNGTNPVCCSGQCNAQGINQCVGN